MIKEGKISCFGGPLDSGLKIGEGTSFYEDWEADKRPDLFWPASHRIQGVGHRLRNTQAFYIALNVPKDVDRNDAQKSMWKITNIENGFSAKAFLVDRGPSAGGRLVDASDALLAHIECKTDDIVKVEEMTAFDIPFGLYRDMEP